MDQHKENEPTPLWATVVSSIILLLFVSLGIYFITQFVTKLGPPNVSKYAKDLNISALIEVLTYDGDGAADLIQEAEIEIVNIGTPAVSEIESYLGSDDFNEKGRLLNILGQIGGDEAKKVLIDYATSLCNSENTVNKEYNGAIFTLASFGTGAINDIESFLSNEKCNDAARKALLVINIDYASSIIEEGSGSRSIQNESSELRPVIIIEDRYDVFYSDFLNDSVPETWRALGEPEKIQLILQITGAQNTKLTNCVYGDTYGDHSTLERTREDTSISLIDAETGDLITSDVIEGKVKDCPEYIGGVGDEPVTYTLDPNSLIDWLQPYIEE